ncbi:unnamed protein product (macronuclear) [Paramecium tetraurelia]|uniref:Uncharacterized protein n=1 Tax=Paramecium tetraurelia TaxID=5888 RepID=A0DB08_PARTE|nr:uncharacterized protein GSPATT00039382001 [Paramecium tetraurelia]CAK80225.1 unnamed protein product [Paramecium tetraurelia]|eukprot:XP_001447622.1 hypothetical protein (macronuclear) [Paramecium tetraurelia strain d4-2]
MKKSDQFISGSQDYSIMIWTKDQNNSWICKQKIFEHTKSIICLVLNNNEDLIVFGSQDSKIKFWQKQDKWLCSQTISEHNSDVFGLSFNEQQNKLISCGRDQLIYQQWNNYNWINNGQQYRRLKQTLMVKDYALLMKIHSHFKLIIKINYIFLRQILLINSILK